MGDMAAARIIPPFPLSDNPPLPAWVVQPADWRKMDDRTRGQTLATWVTLLRLAHTTLPQQDTHQPAAVQSRAAVIAKMLGASFRQPWVGNAEAQRQVERMLRTHENILATPPPADFGRDGPKSRPAITARETAWRQRGNYLLMIRRQAPWALRLEFLAAAPMSSDLDVATASRDDISHRASKAPDRRVAVEFARAGLALATVVTVGTGMMALMACALALTPALAAHVGLSAPHAAALITKAKAGLAQSSRWNIHLADRLGLLRDAALAAAGTAALSLSGVTPGTFTRQLDGVDANPLLAAANVRKNRAIGYLRQRFPQSDHALIEHLSQSELVAFACGSDTERAVILHDNPPTIKAEFRALIHRAQDLSLSDIDKGRWGWALATVKKYAYILNQAVALTVPPAWRHRASDPTSMPSRLARWREDSIIWDPQMDAAVETWRAAVVVATAPSPPTVPAFRNRPEPERSPASAAARAQPS